ncbi:MAG: hypothetical protein H0X37_22500 [Herpetosiphonaceae bacterium]|nr:hypothetical protein [Herpetosiphonaceae bacterium]
MVQGNDSLFVIPDDGLGPFLQVVTSAQHTLDVYVFELTNSEIEQAFGAAQRRGVVVRAIIEPKPSNNATAGQGNYDRLKQAGIAVKFSSSQFVKTHVKALVADGTVAIIATMNFTATWQTTRDYGIITYHSATVTQFAAIFEADWKEQPVTAAPNPASHLVVSPTFGRPAITDLLDKATASISIQHEQLTDPTIIDLLRHRAQAAIEVKVIGPDTPQGQTARDALQAKGAPVQVLLQSQPKLHAKIIIVDQQLMLLGSHNLTAESLDQRREVSLLTDDKAWIDRVLAAFAADVGFASN